MQWELTEELASQFAKLPLAGLRREYPNAPGLVLNGPEDLRTPRELHPAFYGCFDWHSSVHGHWMLVRLLRRFALPEAPEIRALLADHLTAANLTAEAAYFELPGRRGFERTYGWAWLLKLAEELRDAGDPEMAEWAQNLRPLESAIVDRYLEFLPKATYPIRTGTHPNSAFGLSFAHDYATAVGHNELREMAAGKARAWFGDDADYPAHLEPGGADFFSPSLMEADLMRRMLSNEDFATWFGRFLPDLDRLEPLLTPAVVSDRTDGQIAHLDGLNLSRAWCLRRIGMCLPEGERRTRLLAAADMHAAEGVAHVVSGDYAGEHWLASFAVNMLG
ncbi:MAG TPA: DUF2891 domain-containing protein [Fimbriimonadaceae bacterium]|nr:DUF2891 domain-containing protein [Fimbriimonadaceae bacterium]